MSRGQLSLSGIFLTISLLLSVVAPLHAAKPSTQPAADSEAIRDGSTSLLAPVLKPWAGDFDAMQRRRAIRVLVVYNRAFYFIDKYREYGITYETLKLFEKDLNKRLNLPPSEKINVVFVPVSRDRLIPGLVEGLGDVAAANLTITPQRLEQVDFSQPFTQQAQEILLTAKSSAPVPNLDALSGREIVVRASSSYHDSLAALNDGFRARGMAEIQITAADELLEDDAIVEMVNAGLYAATVMDLHKAELWASVFPNIVVHRDVVLRRGGQIAWAFRKDSPKLKGVIDRFVKENKSGSATFNILVKRYLKNTKFVKNVDATAERERFQRTVAFFQQFGTEYDFDWLMLVAQAFQESGLDQSVRSAAGAVGVMQVLPSTAAGPPISIPDVTNIEANIRAGAKYLRWIMDTYFDDPQLSPLDRQLLAFASYNAGPGKIARLRRQAQSEGLDPNRWFGNVEITVSKVVGRETVEYVQNIFKYYVAYKHISRLSAEQRKAKERITQ